MKKTAVVLVALLICLALSSLGLAAAPSAGPKTALAGVDTVASATPNYYRNFTESYLKSLPLAGGYYSCLKNKSPYTYFWQDWYGVSLANLLNEEVGLMDGSTAVRLYAADGWSVDYSLNMVMNPNSQGLPFLLAWQKGADTVAPNPSPPHQEPPLPAITDPTEGPFRSAYGQQPNVGDYASGGTPNFQNFLKTVRAVEVQPLPSGVTPVDLTTIPADKIVVYGNIHPYGITNITPATGPVGAEVTINGFGFGSIKGSSSVSFGAVPVTDYVSWGSKQIKCKVPAGVSGTVDVTVTTSEGASNAVSFTEGLFPPTVTSINPTYGVQGWAVVSITDLVGTGFQPGATVRVERGTTVIDATDVNVVSDTKITCNLNLAGNPDFGKYDVVVKNPDAQEGKLAQAFSVTNACGGGATISVAAVGLVMGLLSIAGIGEVTRRRRKIKK